MTATKNSKLIFDLGMHRGEDTRFYLAKGFNVVAFEADPDLVEHCREQFSDEIASGQLIIESGAIVADSSLDSVTFYKNPTVTVWGTVDPAWKDRNSRMGWQSEEITVPTVDFSSCIEKYGVPYYAKIDIEGADMLSLKTFGNFAERPDYISIESSKLSLDDIREELDVLAELGYDMFKPVQQATIPGTPAPRPSREGLDIDYVLERDSSGLFGRETPGRWRDRAGVLRDYRWIMLGYRVFGNDTFMRTNRFARRIWRALQRLFKRPIPGWYDTHARHSSVTES